MVAYEQLEALDCVKTMDAFNERGCFEVELRPDDCKIEELSECGDAYDVYRKKSKSTESLGTFLVRKCGAKGHEAFQFSAPDLDALKAQKAQAAKAEQDEVEKLAEVEREAQAKAMAAAVVEPGKPRVKEGSLNMGALRSVASEGLGALQECYGAGLRTSPDLQGELSILMVVTPTGEVRSAVVSKTTLEDPSVGRCMAKATTEWELPKPKSTLTIVEYPFSLSSRTEG